MKTNVENITPKLEQFHRELSRISDINKQQKEDLDTYKKENEEQNLDNLNNINNRMDKEMDPYSFRILANDNFHYRISKGEKKLSIEFIIENNGKLAWPENETFLLIDENRSAFKIKKLYLFPLQPQEKCFVFQRT